MICRMWKATAATLEQALEYQGVALGTIIPEIEARNIHGFRQIDMLRYLLPDGTYQFVTLMWFDDEDSVRLFSGTDDEVSYLPSEITSVLSQYDERVMHYEVIARRPQE